VTTVFVLAAILLAAPLAWYLLSRKRRKSIQADVDREIIIKRLQEIESSRQSMIDTAAHGGVTISREGALKHVEALRQSYLSAGNVVAAGEVERVMADFREKHGPEIPVDVAYTLMNEIESKRGQ
jgi:hypothetical protein